MTIAKKISRLSFFFILLASFLGANIPTYFSYAPSEIEKLKSLNTSCSMNTKDLEQWDEFILKATKDEHPSSVKLLRMYTYLYVAQSEALNLSYDIKGSFSGTLAPLTYSVFSLFYPASIKPTEYCEDPFSLELSNIVMKKIKERIESENSQPVKYKVPKEKESIYVVGLTFTNLIPWHAIPLNDYFPPPPSSSKEFWQKQIQILKGMQHPLTKEKKQIIQYWAGANDPQASDWRNLGNQYLFNHNLSYPEIIKIRSSLMMGIYDSMILGFSAKYQFLSIRPKEFDPSVHYEIPVPKHPSYPANHSLIGWTAATILSYYLPEATEHWECLAREAGISRIWAGIHYPIDIDSGKEIGIKIGKKILNEKEKPVSAK